jgi:thioredoxin reductase (NADPH)
VIIGSGPAGLEAALNLRIRQKNFLLFGSRQLSAKLELAPKIENYLGFPAISGQELKSRFEAHLSAVSVEIVPEQVNTVYPMGGYFAVATARRTVEATAVLLCLGVHNAKELPGERAFLGKGVSYCATCDAPLYKGKIVAVIGDSDDAAEEANFLAGIAAKVYYLPGKRGTEGLSPSVEIVSGPPREIAGEGKVCRLMLNTGVLAVDGVFILRETIAPASLVPGLEMRDGFIRVDADMQTGIPGLYAAGDCTGKPHQYMRAAGQGQTAALNAAAYLDRLAAGK